MTITLSEIAGWGALALVLLYLAVRLGGAAWFKSKREHDIITSKRT